MNQKPYNFKLTLRFYCHVNLVNLIKKTIKPYNAPNRWAFKRIHEISYEMVDLEKNDSEKMYSKRDLCPVITVGLIILLTHTVILYCIALRVTNNAVKRP